MILTIVFIQCGHIMERFAYNCRQVFFLGWKGGGVLILKYWAPIEKKFS